MISVVSWSVLLLFCCRQKLNASYLISGWQYAMQGCSRDRSFAVLTQLNVKSVCTLSLSWQVSLKGFLEISQSCSCSILWGVTVEPRHRYSVVGYVLPRISTCKSNPCCLPRETHPTTPGKIGAKGKRGHAMCNQHTHFVARSRWIKMRSLYDFWI